MPQTIDYFFSLLSPYAYLGGRRFVELAARYGATVRYKPVQGGPLFAATGGIPLPQRSPQRRAYRLQELRRWSDHLGLPLNLHPRHFPTDESLAARMVIAADAEGIPCGSFHIAVLRAVWAEDKDVADRAVLTGLAAECGLDAAALIAAADRSDLAARHEANTREAIDRGVFGMPSYVLGDEIFWGQDRLDFLERALAQAG